ncbi:MAG: hypothetical protein HWE10_10715, partial [Gammaproteobacteria bacterium]|nr:hypothetical protein [Gammaproteobacteria bacterium]
MYFIMLKQKLAAILIVLFSIAACSESNGDSKTNDTPPVIEQPSTPIEQSIDEFAAARFLNQAT